MLLLQPIVDTPTAELTQSRLLDAHPVQLFSLVLPATRKHSPKCSSILHKFRAYTVASSG